MKFKKIAALSLVLVMSLAMLTACNGGGQSQQPASPSQSEQPPPPSQSAPPSASAPAASGGTIGYVTDEVDHYARDSYHFIYFNYRPANIIYQVLDALDQLGKKFNFTVEQLTAEGDADRYISDLQTILLREPDGLVIDITMELSSRVSEILRESNTPAICIFNKPIDADGVNLVPALVLNQVQNGITQMKFLESVYKDYWGDIDRSKINLLIMDWSANLDLSARGEGALQEFERLFPGNTHFYGDTSHDTISAEVGFSVATSILSANPNVEYWFIVSTVEDVALGVGRAVEALNMTTDKVLATSSGAAILPGEWEAGYDGVWIANYSAPPVMYAGYAAFGLIAMADGRATMDNLWIDEIDPGDKATCLVLPAEMMTIKNFSTYIADIAARFGI